MQHCKVHNLPNSLVEFLKGRQTHDKTTNDKHYPSLAHVFYSYLDTVKKWKRKKLLSLVCASRQLQRY